MENSKDFFTLSADSLLQEYQLLKPEGLTRTQDVKLMEQMFSVPRMPGAIVPTGHTQYTLLDKINQKISENDKH